MAGRKHKPQEIIGKLRAAEIVLAQGGTVPDACRSIGVTEGAFHHHNALRQSARHAVASRTYAESDAIVLRPGVDMDSALAIKRSVNERRTRSEGWDHHCRKRAIAKPRWEDESAVTPQWQRQLGPFASGTRQSAPGLQSRRGFAAGVAWPHPEGLK